MVDDEELRARIRARVAARRAEVRPVESEAGADDAPGSSGLVDAPAASAVTDDQDEQRRQRFAALHAAATAQAAGAVSRVATPGPGCGKPGVPAATGTPDEAARTATPEQAGAGSDPGGPARRAMRWLFTRAPEPMPQPTREPMPQPTPEPMPQPTPEPMPQPTPEPMPQPTPEPTVGGQAADTSPRPRPSARSGRSRPRPRPGSRAPGRSAPRRSDAAAAAPVPSSTTDGTRQETAGRRTSSEEATDKAAGTAAAGETESRTGAEPAPKSTANTRRAVGRRLLRIGVLLSIAAIAIVLLRVFVVAPYYIPSGSMEPTLHGCHNCNDDRILVDKISYRFHDPQRTDIVVFNRPKDAQTPDKILIKRVIGVPGDKIMLRAGRVWLDGKPLREPYVRHGCASRPLTARSQWTIPSGDVFVMGDNRCDSLDSRQFGPIPMSSIIGRAFVIVWPLSRLGWL